MSEMHVYTDGTMWVVARSPLEASSVAFGEDWDDWDKQRGFVLVPDDEEFTIDDDKTKTFREWAGSFDGPGFLATMED